MAEKHYVDPKDQHIAATGPADHSELSAMYRASVKKELEPWMQEDERQKKLLAERNKVIKTLRKSAFLVGLFTSLPVVLGILFGQLAMTVVLTRDNAMAFVFIMVFLLVGFFGMTYALFKWVGQTFRNHTVRALPISLTTLLSMFFLVRPIFETTGRLVGELTGYAIGLVSLLAAGILIAMILIFAWTSIKIHPIAKIVLLFAVFGATVAIAYLT